MTNEELARVLNTLDFLKTNNPLYRHEINVAIHAVNILPKVEVITDHAEDIAKALESQPCENAISREDTLNKINTLIAEYIPLMPIGWTLPLNIAKTIKELPSVTPQPKTGHWISDVDRWGDVVTTVNGYRCDKCNAFNSDKDNFCPNCGADMRGDADEVDN